MRDLAMRKCRRTCASLRSSESIFRMCGLFGVRSFVVVTSERVSSHVLYAEGLPMGLAL